MLVIENVIDKVIEDYKNGNISEEIFKMTKETVLNDLYISKDTLIGMVNFYQLSIRYPKRSLDIEERIKEIEKVTMDDIKAVARCLKKDTIVLLKGVKNNNEEIL